MKFKMNQFSTFDLALHVGLFAVCFVLIYVKDTGIQDYSSTPKWIGIACISLLGTLFTLKKKVALSSGMLIWGLFVLQFLVQSARSYNFWEATSQAIPLLMAPLMIAQLTKFSNHAYRKLGLWLAVILLPQLLFCLYHLFDSILLGQYSHQSTYEFRYAFGHRNQFSHFLVLSIPLIFISFSTVRARWTKVALVATILLITLTIILLQNRASLLVLLGAYPLCITLYWLVRIGRKKRRRFLMIGAMIILFLVIFMMTNSSFVPGFDSLFETNFGSGNERIRLWYNSWDLVKEQPFFGHGSGDWKIEILRTPLDFTQAEDGMVFYQRAHNDFIQIAVENGLFGVLLLIVFFADSLMALFKFEVELKIKYALLAGLLGFVMIGNLSFPLEKIELLVVLFAFLSPVLVRSKPPSKSVYQYANYLWACVIVGCLALIGSNLVNEKKYARFKTVGSISHLKEVNEKYYSIDPVSTPIHWHFGNYYFNKEMYIQAKRRYLLARSRNPYHIHVLNNLGSTYLKLNAVDSAKFHYQKALVLCPKFSKTLMNMAAIEFNEGNIDRALGHLLNVKITNEPSNYSTFIATIGQAKCHWLVELYDEPNFEQFLIDNGDDSELLYGISVECRRSGASFEHELRMYHNKKF